MTSEFYALDTRGSLVTLRAGGQQLDGYGDHRYTAKQGSRGWSAN